MTPAAPRVAIVVPDASTGPLLRGRFLAECARRAGASVTLHGFAFREKTLLPLTADETVHSFGRWRYAFGVLSALRSIDADLLIVCKAVPVSFGYALLHRAVRGTPILLDIDDLDSEWPNMSRPVTKFLETRGSMADGLLAGSRDLQRRFGGLLFRNGTDTDLFDPAKAGDRAAERARLGWDDYIVALFPGSALPHKGLTAMIAAVARLNDPRVRLAVPQTPHRDGFSTMDRSLDRWIVRYPWRPIDRMPALIAASDLVVVPQQDVPVARAQFPVKLADAMAMAMPILATRVGDIPEALDGVGYLVPPGDVDALAKGIADIVAHPDEARERGRRARERCVAAFSVAALAPDMRRAIAETLENAKAGRHA